MKTSKRILCAAVAAVQLTGLSVMGTPAYAASTGASRDTIAAGSDHSLVIKSDLSLWAAGSNSDGQLGVGMGIESSEGVKVLDDIIFAEANDNVSFAIDKSGTLYGWGDNSKGQISSENTSLKIYKPEKLMENVISVSAGDTHTVAVTADGTAFGWGSNTYGELGNNINAVKNSAKKLAENIVDAAAGDGFTILVTGKGRVLASGYNYYGQLGNGTENGILGFTELALSDIIEADAGNSHTLLLTEDGRVLAAGLNEKGQAAHNSFNSLSVFTDVGISGAEAIFAGGNSSAAVNGSGRMYAWGENTCGQLHNGENEDVYKPEFVTNTVISAAFGESHSLLLKENGYIVTVGDGSNGELFYMSDSYSLRPEKVLSNVKKYAAGTDHAAAVDYKGDLYTWGNNDRGQLGLGDYTSRNVPTKVELPSKAINVWCGDGFTFVQTEDLRVFSFGNNSEKQLGISSSKETINTPQANIYLVDMKGLDIQCEKDYCIALWEDDIYGWGKNAAGRLGDWPRIQSVPVELFAVNTAKKIVTGTNHCFALTESGEIYGWGSNSSSQLGMTLEDASYTEFPEKLYVEKNDEEVVFTDIAAAGNHTIAVDKSGKVWVWGANSLGQLANSTARIKEPKQLSTSAYKVFAGENACAIITDKAQLYLSGSNKNGALGDGTTTDRRDFTKQTGIDIEMMDIGENFGGYVRGDSALYCWGTNSHGQVGNGKGGTDSKPVTAIKNALCKPLTSAKSIILSETELILRRNLSSKLTAKITPADSIITSLKWSSSDTKVATVSADGTVRGVNYGTAVITATAPNGVSASCNVTVTIPVTTFTTSPKSKTLTIGQSFTIATKVYPSTALDKTLIYESADPKVATVDKNGKVTAISGGWTKIKITAKSNPAKTRTVTVFVRPEKVVPTSRKSTADGIMFKWDAVENADGYTIYRRDSLKGTSKVMANTDALTFIDETAEAGKTYYYFIRSYITVGNSKLYSNSSALYKMYGK